MATSSTVGAPNSRSEIPIMLMCQGQDRQTIGLQEWSEDPTRFNPHVQAWLDHPNRSEVGLSEVLQLAVLDIEAGQYVYDIKDPTEAAQLEAVRLDLANFYFLGAPAVRVQKTVLLERIRRGSFRVEVDGEEDEDDDDRLPGYFKFTEEALEGYRPGLVETIERAAVVSGDMAERARLVEDFMCAPAVEAVDLPAGELLS